MERERQSASSRKRKTARLRERVRNKRVAAACLCFLALVATFVLGFAVRSQTSFVQSLGFPVQEASSQAVAANDKTTYDAISERVGEVEDILKSYSMDELDLTQATISMLTDLLKATNDPYAQYFDSARYENYVQESSNRNYRGVGVLFGEYDGRAYVTDVFEGSQAYAMGIEQGDFVVSINGDSSHEWTMAETVGALDGDEGTAVVITWMRPTSIDAKTGDEFTTTLECKRYDEPNVTSALDEEVGYIKIRQITANAASLVQDAVRDLSRQGARAFVIDVRDNPGGYLTQSLDMASLFVPSGILVEIQTNDGTSARNASGETITDAPVVVLDNSFTAASAEVFVAALQDNQRATTVGQTTMGKGSVQVVRELSFGGAARYTAAYYLTPLGHDIEGVGVTPDVTVANGSGPDADDTQLLVAMDSARSLIEAR
ncbi:S41 family peptidase [Adlercreutzia murintestinalis]|uniref:S41 family peptidase n=1 Tax=Adlercreutzia murintestinalis TaxID=2941325 RepID=UPI0020405891|nr:S41 family peptidase [Adlercreutzia murintestinalis]